MNVFLMDAGFSESGAVVSSQLLYHIECTQNVGTGSRSKLHPF